MENPQQFTDDQVKIAPPVPTTLPPSMEKDKVAPPSAPPKTLLPIIALELMAVALGSLVAFLVNLPADVYIPGENGSKKIEYTHILAYRCMVTSAVIGIVLTILLSHISLSQLVSGNLPSKFTLYNEIMLIVLGSGGAASVGLTMELRRLPHELLSKIASTEFLDSIYVPNCIYLLGFVSNFVSSILTRVAAPSHARS